jgi:putative OmpL-like beta-barrel porin-2
MYGISFARRVVAVGILVLASASALADSGPVEGCAKGSDTSSFWKRLGASYKNHLFPEDTPAPDANAADASAAAAEPTGYRKDLAPPPESFPPWPYSVWTEGGTEMIGYENMYYDALMDAIYCGPNGKAWKDSRVTIYGWIEPGANVSTSTSQFNKLTGTGGNYPAAYSYVSNTIQLDQAALYFERTPDEIQTAHNDWGFRLTLLEGADYKYTFSNGILSYQYTEEKRLYGFDPVMYYLDFYFPKFFQGENLRIGRYISLPDIEAQLAPNNLTYSHSLLYTYDPYTQNGIVSTTLLNKNWRVQLEVSAGNDINPFAKQFRQFTPAACVIWTSDSGQDALYPCMNGLNNQQFGWNNIQHAVGTWYHKINDRWHTDTEAWYMWEKNTPNVLSPQGAADLAAMFPPPQYNIGAPSGAQCSSPSVEKCTSHSFAVLNYLNYTHDAHNIWSWRSDFFADSTGQRTGFKGDFLEFTLGYTHWVGDALELRPELRMERQLSAPNAIRLPNGAIGTGYAYNNPCYEAAGVNCTAQTPGGFSNIHSTGGARNQAMLAVDAILNF